MATPAPFCGHCGRPFADGAAFCGACGRPRGTLPQDAPRPAPPAAPARPPAAPARPPAAPALAPAASGLVGALPWQTVLAGQRPDVGAFLARAGASGVTWLRPAQ